MPKKSQHPHVAWRGGRPRFQPAVNLRLEGHVSHDLRHPDGRWFSFEEAVNWSRAFLLKRQQAKAPEGEPLPLPPETALHPVSGRYERGFIYFLWAGSAIKVGYSRNPFGRVGSLMTGVSDPVRLFFTVPGTRGDERRLHRRLRSQHLRGEWFKASTATLLVLRMVLNESDGIRGEQ